MSKFKTIASLSAAAAALSACGHSAEIYEVANQDHRKIEAREVTKYLELGSQAGFLSSADRKELQHFIGDFHTGGYGELVVTAPEGVANVGATLVEVQEVISDRGVNERDIVVGGYTPKSGGRAPIVLAFQAYEAHVPGCSQVNEHDWSDIKSNTSLPSFGCAVNENIAMMLADPADALGQRRLDPADAQRQGVLLEKYRAGANTSSGQTADGSTGGS